MASLYTKNGVPLRVNGSAVFGPSGAQIGKIRGSTVYAPDGRYAGTIVGDRLVYRSTHSGSVNSPFAPRTIAATGAAHRAVSGIWGDEPILP